MTRRLRLLIPISAQVIILIFLAAPFLAHPILAMIGSAPTFMAIVFQMLVPVGVTILYGFHRVSSMHPLANPKYGQWLATTPWTYGKPLPLGPVRLVWEDALVVAVFMLIATVGMRNFLRHDELGIFPAGQSNDVIHLASAAGIVAVCFLLTYLVGLTLTITRAHRVIAAIMCLIPLTFYPHMNVWVGLGVFAMICVLIGIGLRQTFRRFPWDSPSWTRSPKQLHLDQVHRQGLIGWPIRQIGPSGKLPDTPNTRPVIVFSIIVGWWLLAVCHAAILLVNMHPDTPDMQSVNAFIRNPENEAPHALWFIWMMIVLFLAGFRTFAYLRDTMPPISFFGRIRTGQLIIPGYDKVLVAPLLALVYGWFGPGLWIAIGLPPIAVPAVCISTLLLLIMLLGPSRESWRHTGQYRALAWSPPINTNKQKHKSFALSNKQINLSGSGQ